jgi:hypothetical protein
MTIATMPALTIEFYLNGSWVDVTQYVRSGSTRIGRRDELDTFQPGSITLEVDNRDRRFDPLNTAGPYYGYLLPGPAVKVRVRATWSAITYDIFNGYIDGWGISPQINGDSTLTLEGFDFLGYYARLSVAQDALTMRELQALAYYGTTTDILEAWIPLGGTDLVAKDLRYASDRDYTFTSAPRQGDPIGRYVTGSSTEFDGTYGAIGPPIPMRANSYEAVTTIFVKSTTAGSPGQLNPILASASYPQARLGIDDQGRFAFIYDTVSIHSGLPGNDGNWHCVQLVHWNTASSYPDQWNFIIDGIPLGTTDTQAGNIEWQLLGFGAIGSGDDPYFTGSLSQLYVVSENSQLEVYQLPSAGLRGLYVSLGTYLDTPDLVPGNMSQLTYNDPFGSPTTSYDTGTVNIAALKWGGTKLDVIYQLTLAERGRIFIDAGGTWQFHDRAHDTTATRSTTVQATFADTGGATVVPIAAIGAIRNGSRFTAQGVTINLPDGQSIQRYNPNGNSAPGSISSIAGNAGAFESFDLPLSQQDAIIWADNYMSQYSTTQIRIEDWSVLPQGKASVAYPVCLGSKIGDRVTVQITPNNTGSQIAQNFMVEQIAHEFTPEQWKTTFSGSPAVNPWLLEDATYGLLEDTTILA